MAVRSNDVQQSVQVIVHEETAKRERLGRPLSNTGSLGLIREQARTVVLIKRHTFVRKIADHDGRKSRTVEVSSVCAHAGAHAARIAEGDSDVYTHVGESSVVIIVVTLVGLGVI